jgi:hypothetical protein
VLIWSTWSAHSPDALTDLQRVAAARDDVGVFTALETGSLRPDVDRLLSRHRIALPEIPLAPARFLKTEAVNQIPTTILFRDGVQVDRRLGAQTSDELIAWLRRAESDR